MRPVGVHVRTGDQGDGQSTYAISVPREIAATIGHRQTFVPDLLPGGTLVYRPLRPIYEPVGDTDAPALSSQEGPPDAS
jgi:hypothetical protein